MANQPDSLLGCPPCFALRLPGFALASYAVAAFALARRLEPVVGFEPTTDGLQNRCSTTELNWRARSKEANGPTERQARKIWEV